MKKPAFAEKAKEKKIQTDVNIPENYKKSISNELNSVCDRHKENVFNVTTE